MSDLKRYTRAPLSSVAQMEEWPDGAWTPYAEAKAALDQRGAEIRERLSTNANLMDRCAGLVRERDAIRRQYDGAIEALHDQDAKLESAKAEIAALKARVAELEAGLRRLASEIADPTNAPDRLLFHARRTLDLALIDAATKPAEPVLHATDEDIARHVMGLDEDGRDNE